METFRTHEYGIPLVRGGHLEGPHVWQKRPNFGTKRAQPQKPAISPKIAEKVAT